MTRPQPEAIASTTESASYDQALAIGRLDPILRNPAVMLLDDLRTRLPSTDVSLEIAALRLLLYRLTVSTHDLPSLGPLMTRVVAVAIQAAQVRRTLDGHGAEELLGAVATILDEFHTNP